MDEADIIYTPYRCEPVTNQRTNTPNTDSTKQTDNGENPEIQSQRSEYTQIPNEIYRIITDKNIELEADRDSLKHLVEYITARLAEARIEIDEKDQENDENHSSTMFDLEHKHHQITGKLERTIHNLEDTVGDHQAYIKKLEKQILGQEDKIQKLKNTIIETHQDIKATETDIASFISNNNQSGPVMLNLLEKFKYKSKLTENIFRAANKNQKRSNVRNNRNQNNI